ALLLPESLTRALEANDRLSHCIGLLARAERHGVGKLIAAPFRETADARALQLLLLVARACQKAADSLAHAALGLRDQVLRAVSCR
ncbi:MAG TPA: hypothetical protein VIW03_00960, partial [Anaeromyxobacter sp.]